MLRVDDVSFAYERVRGSGTTFVLDGVSFEVERGAIVGLLGPNGAGKTTLLRLLDGMLSPRSGHITLEGREVSRLPRREVARRIAVVPQETRPAFDFTVLDIVLMGRYAHVARFELEGPDDLRSAREAMAATRTASLESRLFDTLSGGEKQRVILASALAQTSDVLILDEPTASLDLQYQLEIAALVTTLNRVRGTTMILSTHDLNLAAAVCSELVLLRRGRILTCGPTDRILTADAVRELYDVEAEVSRHARTGHLTVVPIAQSR